jgi:hypothetical protein
VIRWLTHRASCGRLGANGRPEASRGPGECAANDAISPIGAPARDVNAH